MDGRRAALHITVPSQSYVGRCLAESGLAGYEPETMSCFLAALEVLPPGDVFDIGANIGVFALVAAARTNRTAVAFEPTPQLAAIARQLAELNDLSVRVEECALGAESGAATLYLSDVTDSSNSLRRGFRPSSQSVTVPVRTVDDYCRAAGLQPILLKVDTESTEPDVLRGAAELLARHRPWIVCEVLAGRTERDLTQLLGPLDYAWYQITDDNPLAPREEILGDPTYAALNWLFAPRPPGDAYWAARARWLDALRRTPSPTAGGDGRSSPSGANSVIGPDARPPGSE